MPIAFCESGTDINEIDVYLSQETEALVRVRTCINLSEERFDNRSTSQDPIAEIHRRPVEDDLFLGASYFMTQKTTNHAAAALV